VQHPHRAAHAARRTQKGAARPPGLQPPGAAPAQGSTHGEANTEGWSAPDTSPRDARAPARLLYASVKRGARRSADCRQVCASMCMCACVCVWACACVASRHCRALGICYPLHAGLVCGCLLCRLPVPCRFNAYVSPVLPPRCMRA